MGTRQVVSYGGEFHVLDEFRSTDGTARAKCGKEFPAADAYPVTMAEALPATARCEGCLTREAVEAAEALG